MLSKPLYKKIGAGKNERILNFIKAPFEKNFLRDLPGSHAFSGCDLTSAFHGILQIQFSGPQTLKIHKNIKKHR